MSLIEQNYFHVHGQSLTSITCIDDLHQVVIVYRFFVVYLPRDFSSNEEDAKTLKCILIIHFSKIKT